MAKYRVVIDKGACIGAADCMNIEPSIFKVVNGKAEAQKSEIDESELKKGLSAAKSCPTNAIKIINIETGQEIPI